MAKLGTTRTPQNRRAADVPSATLNGKTDQRLIAAAASLLDSGGESAVTLRAVALAVGVSHNAPYKHFEDRRALLTAVAIQDMATLTDVFAAVRRLQMEPLSKLRRALTAFIAYGRESPARYRLLFSDLKTVVQERSLEMAAMRSFSEFAAIVQECQTAAQLPDISNAELTGILYASVHGLIDLQAGGHMRKEKGLADAEEGVALLIKLLSRVALP